MDIFKKYGEYILGIDPNVNMIIKGHLIIEEQLNLIVDSIALNPASLKKARLSFAQLSNVTQAFLNTYTHSNLWPSITKLNKLRNLIAHNIEPSDLDIKISGFVETALNGVEEEYLSESAETNPLEFCLGLIIGQLEAIKEEVEP